MQQLLIAGGGFAGLWAALTAARQRHDAGRPVDIALVSRDPYLTLRPRLYEKNPSAWRHALGPVLDAAGVRFIGASIEGVDVDGRRLSVRHSGGRAAALSYDRLVLALGSRLKLPAIAGIEEHGWNIDTFDAACAFEAHLREVARHGSTEAERTFVVIGAGFTGIELATELRDRLEAHSDSRTAAATRIILIEQGDVVGPDLGPGPRPVIERALEEAAVELRLGTRLDRVGSDHLRLASGERIDSHTIVVATGLEANPLTLDLAVARDGLGRLHTDDLLQVEDLDGVYAAGDIAHARVDDDGHIALMSCQHSMMMGKFAGYNAARDLLGLEPRPYRQPRYVTCLDLGRSGAVFTRGWERQVEHDGSEAKAIKGTINGRYIYPPEPDRGAVLEAAVLDTLPGRR